MRNLILWTLGAGAALGGMATAAYANNPNVAPGSPYAIMGYEPAPIEPPGYASNLGYPPRTTGVVIDEGRAAAYEPGWAPSSGYYGGPAGYYGYDGPAGYYGYDDPPPNRGYVVEFDNGY